MSPKRKIAIVTGTRAEYGHLYWIIKEVQEDPDLILQLVVTGMHLSPEFGFTVKEIEADGFPIEERVEMLLSSDSEVGISTSIGVGIMGLSRAFERLRPDILVLLGDRFEALAAATAAVVARIPIAHIHGGESTEGAIDEPFRHAITKMSHIHFPATEFYGKRIRQMGEDPSKIFTLGAPGLDHISRGNLPDRKTILAESGIDFAECFSKDIAVVTYHPVTLECSTAERQMANILEALRGRRLTLVFTYANADTGGRVINRMIGEFVKRESQAYAFPSLGQRRYLGLLRAASVVVGNSSSGIIEASALKVPTVNIGDRQRGRVRAANVVDCGIETKEIAEALDFVLRPGFKDSLRDMVSPYGSGEASSRIVSILKQIPLGEGILKKRFWD
ncbi:MAG: UDP-N-acetylglucosamine 2-epimerase [Deltaproteobacteria bacterium]|nr:UDP-N-acetylglucosamine 2-epimerase [Deltaproteobacteria bacterium]